MASYPITEGLTFKHQLIEKNVSNIKPFKFPSFLGSIKKKPYKLVIPNQTGRFSENQFTDLRVGIELSLQTTHTYFRHQPIVREMTNIKPFKFPSYFGIVKNKSYKIDVEQLNYTTGDNAGQEYGLIVLPPNIILQ